MCSDPGKASSPYSKTCTKMKCGPKMCKARAVLIALILKSCRSDPELSFHWTEVETETRGFISSPKIIKQWSQDPLAVQPVALFSEGALSLLEVRRCGEE